MTSPNADALTAIEKFMDLVAAKEPWDGSTADIETEMIEAGVESALAARAADFCQTAFAHIALRNTAVTFSPDYVAFDANGRIAVEGPLDEIDIYVTARAHSDALIGHPAFRTVANTSAEMNALNSLLDGGSNIESAAFMPTVVFPQGVTPRGQRRAHREMMRRLDRKSGTSKPWWRFW